MKVYFKMHTDPHIAVQLSTSVCEIPPCVRPRKPVCRTGWLTEQAGSLSRDDTTDVRKRRALKAVYGKSHVLPAAATLDNPVIPTGISDSVFLSGVEWRDLLKTIDEPFPVEVHRQTCVHIVASKGNISPKSKKT